MWDYTPRQVVGFLLLANRRRRRELADLLGLQALAARGDKEALEKQFKELGGD